MSISIRLTLETELKLEIAIILYKRRKISAGTASGWNWTGLSFAGRKRGLSVKYDVEDFQTDLETLLPWSAMMIVSNTERDRQSGGDQRKLIYKWNICNNDVVV